jgi:hypothetical protein
MEPSRVLMVALGSAPQPADAWLPRTEAALPGRALLF